MGAIEGEIFQLAYVVSDLEAAVDHWTRTLGIGPFFNFPLPLTLDWLELDGQRVDDYDILSGAALAQNGSVQIEILVPGNAASPYRDFLNCGRQGLQHVGMFATDYDRQIDEARQAGIGIAMEGILPLSRFAYLRTDDDFAGTMVELIEPQPAMIELFDQIARASVGWDGRNPLRAF